MHFLSKIILYEKGEIMKKIESILILILLIFVGFEILTESESILNSVNFSLNVFKNNIFPSLFPFFVLSNLLIKCGMPEFMGTLFKGIMNKLFKIKGITAFIFFMSKIPYSIYFLTLFSLLISILESSKSIILFLVEKCQWIFMLNISVFD